MSAQESHMDSREVPGRRINIWLLRAVFSAASIAVMLFLICVALDHKAPPDLTQTGSYSTRLGEHLCQHLPGDSQVCLNTNSAIRYSFSRNTRNVEVVSGEVSFTVRSDSTRPFNVLAGDALVHDLSTSFNVYRKPDSTLVTVIDGRVRVAAPVGYDVRTKFLQSKAANTWQSAPEYKRLQQVEFDEATRQLHERHQLTEDRLAQLLAWQKGHINLNGLTVGEALNEFSRYQPIGHFKFQNQELSKILVGGSMKATNLMDFLDALDKGFAIHHRLKKGADGNSVVMLSRQEHMYNKIDMK
jgi:transmembrane sensor